VAVKIRLKRMGKIRAPFYRIVVADSRTKRDGRVIEEIGKYNPKLEPSLIEVNSERAQHWLSVGAQPSEPVLALLRKTGDWQKYKGEPAPEPLKEQPEKAVKLDVFNAVLKEAHGDTAPDAVSAKQPRKKAAPAEPAATEPTTAESDPAPDATATPADETPEVAAVTAEESADEATDAEQKKSED
jgi:small subunit ribosomal protein S16